MKFIRQDLEAEGKVLFYLLTSILDSFLPVLSTVSTKLSELRHFSDVFGQTKGVHLVQSSFLHEKPKRNERNLRIKLFWRPALWQLNDILFRTHTLILDGKRGGWVKSSPIILNNVQKDMRWTLDQRVSTTQRWCIWYLLRDLIPLQLKHRFHFNCYSQFIWKMIRQGKGIVSSLSI